MAQQHSASQSYDFEDSSCEAQFQAQTPSSFMDNEHDYVPLTPLAIPEVITVEHGVVAADHGICSIEGSRILRKGGNAVDAAVTTALCLGVVSPASSGIGGGGFMLVRSPKGVLDCYDMRETAPRAASRDMYEHNPAGKFQGGLSVAVPGELKGLYEAWEKHGKRPWKELVQPAIDLAEKGFRVSPFLAYEMEQSEDAICRDPGLREKFMKDGTLLQPGDLCRDPQLASTLKKIADEGPSVFYNGRVGADLVDDIQDRGGIITFEDLQSYTAKRRTPISKKVMGREIITMPPPSSGGVGALLVLNILAQYDDLSGPLGLHRMVEAIKKMLVKRKGLGDPDFEKHVEDVVNDMLSDDTATDLKDQIDDDKASDPWSHLKRLRLLRDHGTSHLCVVGRHRGAVSMTTSINGLFGALFRSCKTGIILNNQMDDFNIPTDISNPTIPSASANYIEPFKRPLSSMMPTIFLKDRELEGVIGGSGGPRIIPTTIQVLLNYFIHQLDPGCSVFSPRLYHRLIPKTLEYENWDTVTNYHIEMPNYDRLVLKSKGHLIKAVSDMSHCQIVIVPNKGTAHCRK
ncbi:hypothetical protein AMTRI_Chr05g68590 [Amborella trichopoda]